jgi:hypothetical protein
LTTALELDEAARPTCLIEACSKYPNFALEVLGQAYKKARRIMHPAASPIIVSEVLMT